MTDLSFEGRVALVTGAGQGLGREHARLLAERGASVVVADLECQPGRSPAHDVQAEIEERSGRAIAVCGDVTATTDAGAMVAAAIEAFGRLDIVINNAGIVRDSSIAKLSDEDLDSVVRVHLLGAFNVVRAAWTQMREQGYGRILNTASNAGILGNFGQSNYAAAKMGLVGLTNVLAIEGTKYGIKANVLAPMGRTPMTEGVQWSVFERFDPALAAAAAAWLVHEDCPATGQIFSAAGGHVARFFIGLTPGYTSPRLTPEEVRDHFEQICDTDGYVVLRSATEEIELIADRIGAAEVR